MPRKVASVLFCAIFIYVYIELCYSYSVISISCHRLFTSSIAKVLAGIQTIIVNECKNLKAIVKKKEEEEEEEELMINYN